MANNPIASHNAKPNNDNWNNLVSWDGFLETPIINAENTIPIPAPAPTTPIVAKPAPINLADVVNVTKKILFIKIKLNNYYYFFNILLKESF